jgi:hypothetical protein
MLATLNAKIEQKFFCALCAFLWLKLFVPFVADQGLKV